MVFSPNSALETSTPPTSPLGVPISPSFRSPGSIMGSPLMPHRRPRTSSYPTSPLRSPPDLGPDYMAIDEEEFEEPVREEPRLVIRRLVLINYKSYAGRQVVGPFNENFTAVVGPNGSGKSNVIDSMLFAFGFRAKKMRQDKLTGLIHNSESHPNLQFARVEVHFETTGVPDSELRLAREIRRDGTNFYTLNERRANFSEVAALLEERGIDLRHKRFLILQGEVESISLMPPKAENGSDDGLLEYLEDIIGTTNYKTRIGELDIEQEQLKVDASEKQTRAEIVYKDTRKLDSERAQIERFMINQNKGIIARSSLYQLYISRLKNAIRLSEVELEERQSAIIGIQNSMAERRRRLEEINVHAIESNPQINQWREELKGLTVKLKDAKLREVKLKQQREQQAKRLKKAERELSHATTEKQQSELWLRNFEGDSVKLQKSISEICNTKANELRVLEQMRSELQDSTRELQEEAQRLQNQAEPWRAQISQKNQAIEEIKIKVLDMQKQVEELSAKDRDVVAQAEEIIQTGKASRREVKTLKEHLEKITKEHSEAGKKIQELTVSRDESLRALQILRPEVSSARESRASSQSRNRIESELMRLKIPGLYGRLGSLGSIDQKYDVAISTAGPELNNFVVDNVETAKRCLDELRKRSIGRARFMVLEKLREPNRADPSSFPAPRLLDLVKPVDPLFVKAFSSALGDTLVVDTPENASRTAFNGPRRYNVVTLGGILVNSSGKMSGGGAPSRGLMAKSVATVSPEELETLEKKLANYELEYAESRQRLAHFQARDEELTAEIPRVKMHLDREETSLKQQEGRMNEIKEKRRSIKAEITDSSQKYDATSAQAAPQIAALEKERAGMELTSKPIEEKIQAVQEKILNAGGLRLRQQRGRVTELEERENDIRRQLSDGQQNMASELSKVKKNASLIEKYTGEISTLSETEKEADPELLHDIADMEREMQGLSVLLDKSAHEAETAKLEATELRTEIDELRASEIESANSLQKMMQSQSEKSHKLKDYEQRWASLKLNDVSVAQSLDDIESNIDEKDEIEGNGFDDEVVADDDMDADNWNIKTEQEGEPNHEPSAHVTELAELSPDEIQGLDEDELKREISNSERACESQTFDMSVLDRYRQRYLEYRERKSVSDQALASYEAVKDELQSLTRRRFNEFMEGFREISSKLKELYQLITMGGNAELELVDTMDPFAEGILFSVMPPKKSWRNISNLSGGEKTLSSLALVFALHHYKPTPIYVMDEIDAALDFRNVSIIANYIKERTKNGQFIVISLRNNMFELASRLVGVYKVNNMTRSVALQTN